MPFCTLLPFHSQIPVQTLNSLVSMNAITEYTKGDTYGPIVCLYSISINGAISGMSLRNAV